MVTRAFFEPRFGHDFSGVKVHTDMQAVQSAQAVHGLAYTVGRHLVFGEGRYAPSTQEGRQLLGHELVHVLQQSSTGIAGVVQRSPIPIVEPKREPLDLTPAKPPEEAPRSQEIVDLFVTRVEETRTFNQDERFSEYQKIEYGEGWINIGGGRQKKVQFTTETVTLMPFDATEKGRTTKKTDVFSVEPEYRMGSTPFHLEPATRTRTEDIVNVPKRKPAKPKSTGMRTFAKVGGFFTGVGESVLGLAEGLYSVVRHPITTVQGLGHLVRHPIRTLGALGHAIKSRGAAILSGDTEALGKTLGDIAILILSPEAEVAEVTEGAEGLGALDAAKALDAEATGAKAAEEAEAAGKAADQAEAATVRGEPKPNEGGMEVEHTEKQSQSLRRVSEALKDDTKWGNVTAKDRRLLGIAYNKVLDHLVGEALGRTGQQALHYVELTRSSIAKLRAAGGRVLITEGRLPGKRLRFDMLEIDFTKGAAELLDVAATTTKAHMAKTLAYKGALEGMLGMTVEAKELLYTGPQGELLETLLEVPVK
jgi:hypothetical protein